MGPMSIIVYHISCETGEPYATPFNDNELTTALKFMEGMRKIGHHHVTYSSEHGDHVGKPGVDAVVDGKTPDGSTYDWSKAGRAGKVRQSERDRWAEEAKK